MSLLDRGTPKKRANGHRFHIDELEGQIPLRITMRSPRCAPLASHRRWGSAVEAAIDRTEEGLVVEPHDGRFVDEPPTDGGTDHILHDEVWDGMHGAQVPMARPFWAPWLASISFSLRLQTWY